MITSSRNSVWVALSNENLFSKRITLCRQESALRATSLTSHFILLQRLETSNPLALLTRCRMTDGFGDPGLPKSVFRLF